MINLSKLKKSFRYAFAGIVFAVKNNQNFKVHFFLALVAIILGILVKITLLEWCALVLVITLVLSLEMFNAVTEEVVNLISTDYKKEAKFVKDVGAGMVLVAAIGSVIVGVIIFLPHILKFK